MRCDLTIGHSLCIGTPAAYIGCDVGRRSDFVCAFAREKSNTNQAFN
jgi:hypothetical protein